MLLQCHPILRSFLASPHFQFGPHNELLTLSSSRATPLPARLSDQSLCTNLIGLLTLSLSLLQRLAAERDSTPRPRTKPPQPKAQITTQTQTSQTWSRNDLNAISEDQSFDQNWSPPRFTSSTARPGTANSMRDSSNWRSVFKNRSMNSSLIDLAGSRRRQSSVSSLRCAASDMNLRSSAALPSAHGGSAIRPGMPSRPATSNKSDWVNPLDVHFCKDSASSPVGTSHHKPNATAPATSPGQKAKTVPIVRKRLPGNLSLGSSEGTDDKDMRHASLDHTQQSNENHVIRNGYPSPPQSEKNSEGAFSPACSANSDAGAASVSKRNPSSSLRKVEVPGAKPLPSPAASLQQTSEDRREGPIIRTVPTRRETIAFHQPRGRSLTMEFERAQQSIMTHPAKEGFSGNFADFDFGESVTKMTRSTSTSVQADKGSVDEATRPGVSPPTFNKDSCPPPTTHESFGSEPKCAAQPSGREQSKSPVPTQASDDQVTNSALIDQLPEPPRETIRPPISPSSAGAAGAAAAAVHQQASQEPVFSPRQGFQSSRFNSEIPSRAPPPRPLQPVTSAAPLESTHKLESTARSPCDTRPDNSSSCVREEQPPSIAEVRPPSSPFTRRPLEGAFNVTKGLPRGRIPEPLQTPPVSSAPNDEDDESSVPAWSDLGRSAPRQSALPAPLTPLPTCTSHEASPAASPAASMSPSATAPRIPSPTFPSLADFISTSASTFGTTFTFDFDEHFNSPTLGGSTSMSRQPSTSAVGNKRRAEAKTASPQPTLATMSPSPNKERGALLYADSPPVTGSATTFI
ncbi:hypothetical protein E4U55_007273 [Claviceps digitariae]|nr:hypothetical protein E4U55_007273 [Claviceps digitariae]